MRRLKQIVLGAGLALALALGIGLWLLLRETNVDRDQADYRQRMHAIWSGPAPGTPDTDSVPIDLDSGLLRFLFINEREAEVPYLVAYPVAGTARAPALLLLPGGGYSFRSERLDGLTIAAWFAERGIASFVLDYRVDPFRFPVPLLDAQRAMRWLRAHAVELGIDPRRVGVLGSSAGGHLAALLATEDGNGDRLSPDPVERESSKPDLLILSQAVVSFERFVHEGSKRRLLGNAPAPELVHALSAELRVGPDTPHSFIWTTKTDEFVDYRNSVLFAEALAKHGVEHELHVFPEGPHGRGLARIEKYAWQWPHLCLAWLERQGFHPETASAAAAGTRPN
ncbi:MAG TPA: alpha/beta hydrolase [Polyangiaceae bacterium]|nr:alpha/beta hydrolase [Polyangiaceae bacterium]